MKISFKDIIGISVIYTLYITLLGTFTYGVSILFVVSIFIQALLVLTVSIYTYYHLKTNLLTNGDNQ